MNKSSTLDDVSRNHLQERLEQLLAQYEASYEQYIVSIDPASRVVVQARINQLENKIRQTEQELAQTHQERITTDEILQTDQIRYTRHLNSQKRRLWIYIGAGAALIIVFFLTVALLPTSELTGIIGIILVSIGFFVLSAAVDTYQSIRQLKQLPMKQKELEALLDQLQQSPRTD